MKTNKKIILKTILVVAIYLALIITTWEILKLYKLNSITTLKHICNGSILGYIIFVLLQVIQVVFLPINSIIFTIPAIIIFGPLKAFVICFIGLVIGSIIMFYIGRFGGINIMKWIVGETKAKHYTSLLGKGKYMLPIFMLVAVVPDDILCASAGLSNINFGYFLVVVMATRAIDLAFTCFVGTHAVQSTLGIVLLCVFIVIAIIISIIVTKKQHQLENWFVKVFSKYEKG